jgi:hypothetical protein
LGRLRAVLGSTARKRPQELHAAARWAAKVGRRSTSFYAAPAIAVKNVTRPSVLPLKNVLQSSNMNPN